MAYDPEIHHRRSLRRQGYDYSQPGSYYVTLCTQGKVHRFGQIVEGVMRRNEFGEHVALCWEWLPQQYPYVALDEWIVMPNHLHGIIVMADGRGGSRTAPTPRKPLGRLLGAFKTVSTQRLNPMRATSASRLWQRDFYDHIIRNEDELSRVREYIRTNPLRWDRDPENL